MEESTFSLINNEYDYSTSIPTIEYISYLIYYCDNEYKRFINLIDEDEQKNKELKYEYKNYNYKKLYVAFNVYIGEKSYNNINCKDYESFINAVNGGNLKNINNLQIKLDLNYKRGNNNSLVDHENSFTIIFKPYDIIFARKSNYNEQLMNEIENNINNILKKFPKANSIFCTKED